MYDANKQSKNGIVVSYKHIVPENKIIKIGIRKNDRKLYSMLFLTLAKQFKNKVIAPVDNAKIPKIDQGHCPQFCVNRKLQDSGFILESCFQI